MLQIMGLYTHLKWSFITAQSLKPCSVDSDAKFLVFLSTSCYSLQLSCLLWETKLYWSAQLVASPCLKLPSCWPWTWHIGMALSMYPLSIASAFNHAWIGGDMPCLYYGLMGMIFSITSIMTLAVMGVVRYLATGSPPKTGRLTFKFEMRSSSHWPALEIRKIRHIFWCGRSWQKKIYRFYSFLTITGID